MNKETIVRFLQQDIQELEMLTKGFEEMDKFPVAILDLASKKTEHILSNLSKLKEFEQMEFGVFNYDKVEEKEYSPSGEKNGVLPLDSDEIQEEEETFNDEKESVEIVELQETDYANDEIKEVKELKQIEETQEGKTIENKRPKKQTLEESLNSQRIDDIRNALSIGDRFRFQRELFNNNGELMNKMIAYLNKLANYEEAETFLKRKFNWSDDNLATKDFLEIVKRRY